MSADVAFATVAGFDVLFPSIRDARERMKGADNQTRAFGVQTSDAADRASAAAGLGDLPGALSSLADGLSKTSNKTANVAEELWQALEKAQHEYERSDAAAGAGIDAVRFGGHDGHH